MELPGTIQQLLLTPVVPLQNIAMMDFDSRISSSLICDLCAKEGEEEDNCDNNYSFLTPEENILLNGFLNNEGGGEMLSSFCSSCMDGVKEVLILDGKIRKLKGQLRDKIESLQAILDWSRTRKKRSNNRGIIGDNLGLTAPNQVEEVKGYLPQVTVKMEQEESEDEVQEYGSYHGGDDDTLHSLSDVEREDSLITIVPDTMQGGHVVQSTERRPCINGSDRAQVSVSEEKRQSRLRRTIKSPAEDEDPDYNQSEEEEDEDQKGSPNKQRKKDTSSSSTSKAKGGICRQISYIASGNISDLQFIKSQRKKDLISFEGYLFLKSRQVKDGSFQYYACDHRFKGCNSYIHVNHATGKFSLTKDHIGHLPNPERIRAKQIKQQALELASKSPHIETKDVAAEIENLLTGTSGSNLAPYLCNKKSLARMIRKAKREATGEVIQGQLGTNRDDMVIPENLQTTTSGSQFLLADIKDPGRIVIYATHEMLQILVSSEVWMMTGTFKASPTFFNQLFTIHAVYMDTVIPVVFAFLPEATKINYWHVIATVGNKAYEGQMMMNPKLIISDFDIELVKTCQEAFPKAELRGSLTNFSQRIFQHVTQEGLNKMYVESQEFRQGIQSLTALSFIPSNDVLTKFLEIRTRFNSADPIRKIFAYFQNTYLGLGWDDVMFPISFWNYYPRTNSDIEVWRYRINEGNKSSRLDLSMWKCLEMLQKEQQHWEKEVQKLSSGGRGSKKKSSAHEIKQTINNYNSTPDIWSYLMDIATRVQTYLS